MKKISLLIILFLAVPGYCLIAQTITSIFQPTDVPSNPLENDGNAISVGVKFRSSAIGSIAGVRFYKGAGTNGTHTGQLYSSTGALLASAVFTNETSSGWQEVLFTTPVAILANTTYIASMHSASGDYCFTNPYFSSAVTNAPLKALANGEDGVNGLYLYTSTPALPVNNYQSGNYWVDVIYTPPAINGTANYLPRFLSANFIGNSIVYDNGTNVGIGTSSPQSKLDVNGGITTNAQSNFSNGTFSDPHSGFSYGVKVSGGIAVGGSSLFQNGLTANMESKFSTGSFTDPHNGVTYGIKVGSGGIAVAGNSVFTSGSVAIGTTNAQGYILAVNGDAIFTKVKVKANSSWPDYVFEKQHRLPSLQEVEKYIQQNKHLPDVPSAGEVQTNGLDLGDNQTILLKKIEELTLYIIEQNKKLEKQEKRIRQLEQARETTSREKK